METAIDAIYEGKHVFSREPLSLRLQRSRHRRVQVSRYGVKSPHERPHSLPNGVFFVSKYSSLLFLVGLSMLEH